MPTYEYLCRACGHHFEKFQRMSDEPVAECSECGVKVERKLSGGAGLIFKGSGFYITDYRGEGYKKAAETDEKGGVSKSGSSKSESKQLGSAVKGEAKKDGSKAAPKATSGGD
ncbi:MAG: FmdB family zinc ribbon protein [Longimicrobiaceae bacterium]